MTCSLTRINLLIEHRFYISRRETDYNSLCTKSHTRTHKLAQLCRLLQSRCQRNTFVGFSRMTAQINVLTLCMHSRMRALCGRILQSSLLAAAQPCRCSYGGKCVRHQRRRRPNTCVATWRKSTAEMQHEKTAILGGERTNIRWTHCAAKRRLLQR